MVQEALLRLHRVPSRRARTNRPPAAWCHGGHPARDRRAALGARAARDLRRRVAARADRHRPESADPAARGRARRLALARVPRPARDADAGAAGRLPPPRRLRLPLRRIAEIVGKQRAPSRQLATRARRQGRRAPAPVRGLAASSGRSSRRGSSAPPARATSSGLEELLAADVELHGDGGGKAPALARPVFGRARVARTLLAWGAGGDADRRHRHRAARINGEPGADHDGPGRRRGQRDRARDRERPDPGDTRDRQPGQARPHRPARRRQRALSRLALSAQSGPSASISSPTLSGVVTGSSTGRVIPPATKPRGARASPRACRG